MPKTLDIANKDALPAPKRRNSLDPDRVISMIPIRPYHVVADIGCGPGYFSVPLAKYVNQGRLYAMDTKEKILDACRQRLSEVHLNNVEVLQCGPKKLPLDKDSVDGAFLAFVLNEVRDRNGLLTEAGRSMHKGGWLAILEWHKQATEEGPPLEDRISEEEAKELGQKAGLRYVSERDLNGQNYLILFRK
ncbi:MAG: class I SAM-dependent methyltransferase [Dehalococcoidia bacterium]|jgi:ubiquinone/menaquinone biosynthesis C-methylase UbiE|nr:class I SAM-dependent methyltransferase [Dehalococcoidia bacterium]